VAVTTVTTAWLSEPRDALGPHSVLTDPGGAVGYARG
jgi:hypothetical protein